MLVDALKLLENFEYFGQCWSIESLFRSTWVVSLEIFEVFLGVGLWDKG